MTSLAELYASGGYMPLEALKITTATQAVRLVKAFEGEAEQGYTLAGEFYECAGFAAKLPERGGIGRQDLQFQLDNVTGEVRDFIMAALAADEVITAEYMAFHPLDMSEAQASYKFTVKSCSSDIQTAVITASFHDEINRAWPRRLYTPDKFPGLRYA